MMESFYKEYYEKGKQDRDYGRPMEGHYEFSAVAQPFAYEGYVAGWTGSPYKEPEVHVIKFKPRHTEN